MPCTVPLRVLLLHGPVACTASRPTYVPALSEGRGTSARTRSPARNPPTALVAFGAVVGKPQALVWHICRQCRPVAVISSGAKPVHTRRSGVLAPTQAASSQWALGRPRRVRVHLVRPSAPTFTGNPVARRRRES